MRKALYEQKIRQKDGSDAQYSMEEGVKLVRQGLFAFHAEIGVAFKYVADTYQEHEKCHLKLMDYYNEKGVWYAIRRNSTLRRMVTVAMFRIREHGIQKRVTNLIYTPQPTCQGDGGTFLSIGLADISPAFWFLLWAFLFAAFVLVIELVVDYLSQKYRSGD